LLALTSFRGLRVDDAYISYRYAHNAASGSGLVYNAGERVEGYSNFLWTVLLAAGAKLGVAPEVSAPHLGRVCLALTLLVVWRLAHRFPDLARPGWRGAALALVLTSPALAYWSGAGLETPLFVLLWAASRDRLAAAWERKSAATVGVAAVVLCLLALCRPDGILGVVTALAVWRLGAPRDERRRWRAAMVVVAVVLGAYAGWKLAYYGALLPTTFYAKAVVSGEGLVLGLRSALGFALVHPWVALWVLGPWLRRPRRAPSAPGGTMPASPAPEGAWRLRLLITVDAVAVAAYAVAVGCDPLPYYRFFAVLVPGLALLAVLPLARRSGSPPGRPLPWQLAPALLALWSYAGSWGGRNLESALLAQRVVDVGGTLGAYLAATLPPGSRIAVNAAGALPYASGLSTLDMLGVVDAHIARTRLAEAAGGLRRGHERGDGAYVLAQRPDVVVLGNSAGSFEPVFAADRDLLRQPDFARRYRRAEIPAAVVARRLGLDPPRPRRVRCLLRPPWAEAGARREARLGVLLTLERPPRRGFLEEAWYLPVPVRLWVRSEQPADSIGGAVAPDTRPRASPR
jgi:arabinofuranosyltransferase